MEKLIIATRESKLAMWQSKHVKEVLEKAHKGLTVELVPYKTKGDKILDVPLAKIGGKQLFTKELEVAMLNGDAHIAVHSLKDVPVEFEDGLVLASITEREDERDAMLSDKYRNLDDLPRGAVVGTTSLRRKMQLLAYRNDLIVKDLRGNVNTRIQKLKDGMYDAIILASAGINRLDLSKEVKYYYQIPKDIMVPAMGQAALGIEAVEKKEILDLIEVLNDDRTSKETIIERSFIEELDGGCQVPIGVNAEIYDDGSVSVVARIGLPNGKEVMNDSLIGKANEYETIGKKLASKMISQGAKELLDRALKMS
ncbi:MAG: hydroxymethylbilane synthase [Campylobacterales bacterium]|nr:hydroxymethylbilane synthase [Campylobacterales bacterium]